MGQIIKRETPQPQEIFTVELTFDEMVRLYMLSSESEGGDKFPLEDKNGFQRLYQIAPAEVAEEGDRRMSNYHYVHPGCFKSQTP